jgi:basic amino acid/polyamine antiporter, APA family
MAFKAQIPIEFASFKHGITTDTSTPPSTAFEAKRGAFSVFRAPIPSASTCLPHAPQFLRAEFHLRACHFRLAFSPVPIIMAKFRKVPETLQLPNTSDLSSTPSGSASSGTLDPFASAARGRGRLLKVLGMWFGISAAVGNTIAAGIVRAPGDIAQWLPNIYLFFGVWVIGGLYALSGASSMGELGAAIPRSGGQYNFSRRALGDYAGFVVGWSDWLSTCGTAAAVAIVIGEYSGELLRPLTGHVNLIAILVIIGFFVLQWRGIKWGSGTQLVTAALKTFAFVIVVAACFLFGSHAQVAAPSAAPAPSLPSGWPLALAILLGLQAVFYAIDGWDGIIYFGEEVRNPGRDIPRAIFGSVATVMGIYLLINAAVLYVLPMSQIAGNTFVLGTAAEKIFGPYGDTIIRSIMVISLLSCLNANQLFCSRTLYAMSCDGLFFRGVSRVNAGGTPTLSLLLSTIVGVLFVLVSTLKLAGLSPFDLVIDMLSFFFVANYTLSYASLFVLRRKEPQMKRPYRAWGYPWTTGIALLASALFLVASITPDLKTALTTGQVWPPSPAMLALLILLLSYPVFRLLQRVTHRQT